MAVAALASMIKKCDGMSASYANIGHRHPRLVGNGIIQSEAADRRKSPSAKQLNLPNLLRFFFAVIDSRRLRVGVDRFVATAFRLR